MCTKTVGNQVIRKSNASGAGNDCVYLTEGASAAPFVHDSKSERNLSFGRAARAALVASAAAGALLIGAGSASADVPVGSGSVQVSSEKDWFKSNSSILCLAGTPGMTHNGCR